MVVDVRNAVMRVPELRFEAPVNWTIEAGQQWAVIGPNGSGKTLLADLLQRKLALKEGCVTYENEESASGFVKCIAFKDIYSLTDCRNSYYQQRWNSSDTDDAPMVGDLLNPFEGSPCFKDILSLFNIDKLSQKKIIFLSSGELRKFIITRALLMCPRLLILDNPFIGLDALSRDLLVDTLNRIIKLNKVQVMLLLSNPEDIPDMITHVLPLYDRVCYPPQSAVEFKRNVPLLDKLFGSSILPPILPVEHAVPSSHEVSFRMERVNIKYGDRTILKELNWEVRNGEKWSLSGPNGAGKSTLLSLIYADNPQSYANTLYLFDKKRGSGESIWDIKRRIGYVSPEMHLYYTQPVPLLTVVASGFFDSIGLYRKCTAGQERTVIQWMKVFGIDKIAGRIFTGLSSGEQRLALLARAFVKDPDLVILDEPLHGLDITNKKKVALIIEAFCARPGKTLIYVTHYPNELPACIDKHFRLEKHS